jgi:hypothetical protein
LGEGEKEFKEKERVKEREREFPKKKSNEKTNNQTSAFPFSNVLFLCAKCAWCGNKSEVGSGGLWRGGESRERERERREESESGFSFFSFLFFSRRKKVLHLLLSEFV